MSKVGVGSFVWHELRTTDAQGAADFYTRHSLQAVFGERSRYRGPHAALWGHARRRHETRLDWLYRRRDDVDAHASRVEQAAGKVHCPPQDIPTIGRFASGEDPQRAVFVLFKGSLDYAPPRPPIGSTGIVGWNELSANDGPSAWDFYSNVFGWTEDSVMDMGPLGSYLMFSVGSGSRMGGMMTRDPKMAPRPFWLYYFNIDDIDAAVARVRETSGQVLMEPHQVPGGMWIILGLDPQGAMFAVVGYRKN